MTSRRHFDRTTLELILRRDEAKTNYNKSLPVTSRTVITFTCCCGAYGVKRVDKALDHGMFCKGCMTVKSRERQKESAAKIKADVLNTAEQYLLVLDDGTERIVSSTEPITLMVAQEFLTVKDTTCSYDGCSYILIRYWDQTKHLLVSKKFRIRAGDMVTARTEAKALLESIPSVPKTYRVVKTMQELAENPDWARRCFRMERPIITYTEQVVPVDPYLLGVWLGDGTVDSTKLTNIEPEIIAYWYAWAASNGCKVSHNKNDIQYNIVDPSHHLKNKLKDALRQLGILRTKAIPRIYIENSVDIRMKLIAGLIDTDGSLQKHKKMASGLSYDFVQCAAHETIFDGFREIVHSLGWKMDKTVCIKSCSGKDGVKKQFPAFRGLVVGDERLQNLPILTPRKKISRTTKARHDLQKFQIKSVNETSI